MNESLKLAKQGDVELGEVKRLTEFEVGKAGNLAREVHEAEEVETKDICLIDEDEMKAARALQSIKNLEKKQYSNFWRMGGSKNVTRMIWYALIH